MPTDLQDILKLEVPLIVQIAEHELNVEEVRNLVPGSILELPKSTADDLEILVNDQNIAQGKAVKVGENFGVRITYVGNLKERIEAGLDLLAVNTVGGLRKDRMRFAEHLSRFMPVGFYYKAFFRPRWLFPFH